MKRGKASTPGRCSSWKVEQGSSNFNLERKLSGGGGGRTVVGIKKFVTRVGSRSSSFLKRNRLLHGMGGGR